MTITGRQSVDEVDLLEVDAAPAAGAGTAAVIASLAIAKDGTGLYSKFGSAATAWRSMLALPSTQATAAATLTMTVASTPMQYFTGTTAGQTVKLPDATTLPLGYQIELYNMSSQSIAVVDSASGALLTLSQTSVAYITLQTNGTAAGGWICWQVFVSSLASGILNYQVVASTTFSTSSTTDVVITSFTVTPQAGTYAVWFNLSTQNTSGSQSNFASLYRGGTQIADSERRTGFGAANTPASLPSMTVATFNGSQAADVRVRTTSATAAVNARTLLLIRLGS